MPTFVFEGKEIEAEVDESILGALLRHGVPLDHGCKAGACQRCLVCTNEKAPSGSMSGIDDDLVELGAFLACQAKASALDEVHSLDPSARPRHKAILKGKTWLAEDVLGLQFEVENWKGTPGRFIRLLAKDGTCRAYSIATPAWESPSNLHLHVRILADGSMSRLLLNAQVEEAFQVEGPCGKCKYSSSDPNQSILMLGSGTGLAPLYAIATDALHSSHTGPIWLYHGGATSARLYFRDELNSLAENYTNFHYVPCADEKAIPEDRQGSPLQLALEDFPLLDGWRVYLCGHPALVKAAQKKCFLAGANLRDISADPFEAN